MITNQFSVKTIKYNLIFEKYFFLWGNWVDLALPNDHIKDINILILILFIYVNLSETNTLYIEIHNAQAMKRKIKKKPDDGLLCNLNYEYRERD